MEVLETFIAHYPDSTLLMMKSLTCFQRLMMHIENMKTGHGPNQISVQLHRSLPTKYVFCHFYSCETWSSHIQHLVKMLTLDTENITWYHCVAMRECLSIEFMVMKWKQRWSGHFVQTRSKTNTVWWTGWEKTSEAQAKQTLQRLPQRHTYG